jgi:hypothetical protein
LEIVEELPLTNVGKVDKKALRVDNGLANFGSAMAPAVIGFLIAATGSYAAGLLFMSVPGLIGAVRATVLAVQKY